MKVIKKSNRGRKSGSFSFRRVKLLDLLKIYNVETKKEISGTSSVVVSEKWAATIGLSGIQIGADLVEVNGKNISEAGLKVKFTDFK